VELRNHRSEPETDTRGKGEVAYGSISLTILLTEPEGNKANTPSAVDNRVIGGTNGAAPEVESNIKAEALPGVLVQEAVDANRRGVHVDPHMGDREEHIPKHQQHTTPLQIMKQAYKTGTVGNVDIGNDDNQGIFLTAELELLPPQKTLKGQKTPVHKDCRGLVEYPDHATTPQNGTNHLGSSLREIPAAEYRTRLRTDRTYPRETAGESVQEWSEMK